jgi:ubiquinone/menaquinone biosynthesis C-methylase UbiE
MKKLNKPQINNPTYWDSHQTATDFGLRQEKYLELIGVVDSVVDLGCGLSPFLSRVNAEERWGVDYSDQTVKTMQKQFPECNFTRADVTNTWFKANAFDAVVSGEVIEHLEVPDKLLREMYRLCKPGGIMVFSTPILEFDDPEHLWEFEPSDFPDWNCEVIESTRFKGRSYMFFWKRKPL